MTQFELLTELQDTLTLQPKIDWSTVQVDGVDSRDYPDFSDAFFSYAEYESGVELSEEELSALTDDNGDTLNELAHESCQGE